MGWTAFQVQFGLAMANPRLAKAPCRKIALAV